MFVIDASASLQPGLQIPGTRREILDDVLRRLDGPASATAAGAHAPAAELPAQPIAGTLAERYLREIWGLDFPADVQLRFDPAAPFRVQEARGEQIIYEGPALLAPVMRRGELVGMFPTWLDLAQPDGRAIIRDPRLYFSLPEPKRMAGHKRGGHIDLTACACPRVLVLGARIESVLAAWSAMHLAGRDVSETGFWAAGDLANLAGPAARKVAHPWRRYDGGSRVRVPGPDPELDWPGILIPATVERLVLLAEAGEPFAIRNAMARAARRYARRHREVVVAWPPEGKNFEHMLREARDER